MPGPWTLRTFGRAAFLLLGIGALVSCGKDPVQVDRNRPPSTFLVAAPAESTDASYKIHLYWRGEDPDGYVAGFLWAWDDSTVGAFRFTTKTDTIFELTVNDSAALVGGAGQTPPGTTKAHTFYIRAVDNLGKADPRLTIFNRRLYNASTEKPVVRFVGFPSGESPVDTLCDGAPFTICWTGSDKDGYVAYYRWDVGVFSSPLQSDTCVTFNDPNTPGSVPLISGVYTVTVTAVDNAFARSDPGGGGQELVVVNHDPETWFLGVDGTENNPVGWYIAPILNGEYRNDPPVQFTQDTTIPYRSTVYWKWKGADLGRPDRGCIEQNVITGYGAVLRGTRNGGEPYIIGFRDVLCVSATGDTIRFTTNDPGVVAAAPCLFTDLVLDSLDAGRGLLFNVAARDIAGRADGTPAAFRFNCNLTPTVDSLTYETIPNPGGSGLAKRFRWKGKDPEDGLTKGAELFLDGQEKTGTSNYEQEIIIPESRFISLSGSNPHTVELRVQDRAGYYSDETLSVSFTVCYPDDCPPSP